MTTFFYITLSPFGELKLNVSKTPEIAISIDERESNLPLKCVWFEELATLLEANERFASIRKMNKEKRAAMVQKANPEHRELLPNRPVFVTAGTDGTGEPPIPGAGEGSPAPLLPKGPRAASEARQWPLDTA